MPVVYRPVPVWLPPRYVAAPVFPSHLQKARWKHRHSHDRHY